MNNDVDKKIDDIFKISWGTGRDKRMIPKIPRVRKKERKTDRQTDTHTHTARYRQPERQTERQAHRQTNIDRQTDRQTLSWCITSDESFK